MPQSSSHPYATVRIATSTGPLAQIWLAANMSNLPRGPILQTSITDSANEIAKVSGCDLNDTDSFEHITLHTSGDLLQGIVRVYSKQAAFLLTDIKDTLTKISTLFKSNQRITATLSSANTIAKVSQLILEDAVTEREVLITPGLDFLNETVIPEGLMGQENSMQRKVQGAAPWDTSLEVGRRFNPDDDLEYHQSSILDLDFDIDNDNDNGQTVSYSKTWEEGTRQTVLDATTSIRFHEGSREPDNLIEDDDFPLDDPNNADWNLGVTEKGEQDNQNEEESSIEIGRRAGEEPMIDEAIDFGFDLDIEKEPMEDTERESEALNQVKHSTPAPLSLIQRARRNSALANAKRIEMDNETEFSADQVKKGSIVPQTIEGTAAAHGEARTTQKRLWEEFVQGMSYLPQVVLDNLITYQTLKKQKIHSTQDVEEFNEPEMNVTLGLDDDLLQDSETSASRVELGSEESDHFVPIDEDIGQPSFDEANASSPQATDANGMMDEQLGQLDGAASQKAQNVQLASGEMASRATVYMAELLRTEFIDNDSINFDDILAIKHNAEDDKNDSPITKREASKGFFDMLSLATAGCIDLDQQESFQNITIKTRAPLYEKFITA